MIPQKVSDITMRILKNHGELTFLEATEAAFRVAEMRGEVDRLRVRQNALNICKALYLIRTAERWRYSADY